MVDAKVAVTLRISSVHDESSPATVIEVSGPCVSMTDLGSTQGTFVNGRKAMTTALKSGDTIVVGDTRIELAIGTADETTEASVPNAPEPLIALGFTRKVLGDASSELTATLADVQRDLFNVPSVAHAANAIETKLVPAFDAFLERTDRVRAHVDNNIALGKWASEPLLIRFRVEIERYRTGRDQLAALAKRAEGGELTLDQLWQLLALALGPLAQ